MDLGGFASESLESADGVSGVGGCEWSVSDGWVRFISWRTACWMRLFSSVIVMYNGLADACGYMSDSWSDESVVVAG